jgi:hypothetical protein
MKQRMYWLALTACLMGAMAAFVPQSTSQAQPCRPCNGGGYCCQ